MHSLISTFVICRLEKKTELYLAMCQITIFYLVSVAERVSFNLTWSETQKTYRGRFSCVRPISEHHYKLGLCVKHDKIRDVFVINICQYPHLWFKSFGPESVRDATHLGRYQSKRAKIRNRYNQVPHLTQDTNLALI